MRVPIMLLLLLLNAGCVASECGNELLSEVPSPTNAYVATLFLRNCGATAPLVHVVSIRGSQVAFDPDDMDAYVFTMRGEHAVSVEWSGAKQLVVARPIAPNDIFTAKSRWNDVEISMEP